MKSLISALLLACILSACAYVKPYKIEVNQGNFVTQEMLAKLKPGMCKTQVRNVLGPPLLESAFHTNRWDYQFSLERRGEMITQHQIAVLFDGDALKSWDDKALPKLPVIERDVVIDMPTPNRGGFFQRLSDWWKK